MFTLQGFNVVGINMIYFFICQQYYILLINMSLMLQLSFYAVVWCHISCICLKLSILICCFHAYLLKFM